MSSSIERQRVDVSRISALHETSLRPVVSLVLRGAPARYAPVTVVPNAGERGIVWRLRRAEGPAQTRASYTSRPKFVAGLPGGGRLSHAPLSAGRRAPRVTPPPEESSCARRYDGAVFAVRPDEPSRRPTARRSSFRRYLEMFGVDASDSGDWVSAKPVPEVGARGRKKTSRVSLGFPSLGSRRGKKEGCAGQERAYSRQPTRRCGGI